MKMFHWSDANWFSSASLALLFMLIFTSTAHASKVRYIWQSSDQFVALEQQDSSPTGPAQPNDHPVELTLDRITAILAAIDINGSDNGKSEPLFTRSAVQIIAPHLLQGLHQAAPTEDVTFAVIGLHDALYGLAKSPKVTTGRVFYQAGQLNIIVGLVQQEVRDRDDRRLFPFTPGGRQKASEGEWQLLPQAGPLGYKLNRKDWLIFSNDWRAPVAEKNVPAKKSTPTERLTILKELKEKGLINEEEYRAKRLEILSDL